MMAPLADLALINGKVLTMNPAQPVAEAVAIKNNRIVKVGTNAEIRKHVGKDTKIVRLTGKTVIPGLIDTHIHVANFGRLLAWLDLTNTNSIEEMKTNIKKRVEKTPKGRWVLGRGWNETRFRDKRLPNRQDLDSVSPDNPVILYHEIAQVCVVNSRALELADVTAQTPAPEGGIIDRGVGTGEPTGILRDNATDLVWRKIPEPDEEELLEATALACEKIAEAGVTSVHWMVLSPVEISIAQKLHEQKRLPIRVNLIIPANLLTSVKNFKSNDSSSLRVGGAVIAADGYLASRTAALSKPYSDDPAAMGQLLSTKEEMNATAVEILRAGLQLVIHAMGDRAVDAALTTIENVSNEAPVETARIRFEQAAVLDGRLIERMKKRKVIVSVQPLVVTSEFSVWHAIEQLGAERARWLYPLRTLLGKGVKVVAGSDCPMEPLSPLLGIQAAVTRVSFPEEQVTVDEALRMYTVGAAYSSNEENVKGSIAEGKLADLTVLSDYPLRVPRDKIKEINVDLTVVDGRIVYPKLG
jgi:predicted amidohydrolase YtcJ